MVYKFFSCSTNIPRGLSAYKPQKLVVYCLNNKYSWLYNNQTNARAVIGQSAVGYCAGKPKEKSRVFWIII